VAVLLSRDAAARVPTQLLNAAARAPEGSVSPRAAALSDRVVNAMLLTRLTAATGRLFGLAAGFLVTVVVASAVAGQPPAAAPRPTAPPAAEPARAGPAAGWKEVYVLRHDHPVTALACSADRLAAGTESGELFLSDPLTGKNRVRKLAQLKKAAAGSAGYDQLRFTTDAEELYFVGAGLMIGYTRPGDDKSQAWGFQANRMEFAELAPDCKAWLEARGRSITIRPNLFLKENQVGGGPPYESAAVYKADVKRAVLSPPDGKWLAVLTGDGIVHIHDRAARDEETLRPAAVTIDLGQQVVAALQFAPGGERLAAVGDNGFARVYDAATGKETATLKGHGGIVFCVAFSPDRQLIATGGDDHAARVWDAATGRLRAELKGHTDSVKAVMFDPSGRVVLTASADKTVRAWAPPR
jgi:hypothetical protein